jgi:hypothetical protein
MRKLWLWLTLTAGLMGLWWTVSTAKSNSTEDEMDRIRKAGL